MFQMSSLADVRRHAERGVALGHDLGGHLLDGGRRAARHHDLRAFAAEHLGDGLPDPAS